MANGWAEASSVGDIASAVQYGCFILSLAQLGFFWLQLNRRTAGWEVVYVAGMEALTYVFAIGWENDSPLTVYATNGNTVSWLRYGEWLLTTPVILMAVSRCGSIENTYSDQTMAVITSNQGTIVFGLLAAIATGTTKFILFMIAILSAGWMYKLVGKVYLESYNTVPEQCKNLVMYMGVLYMVSWTLFPILFLAGPEGGGHLSTDASNLGHAVADLLSKNLWAVMEWWLSYQLYVMAGRDGMTSTYGGESRRSAKQIDDQITDDGSKAPDDFPTALSQMKQRAAILCIDPAGSFSAEVAPQAKACAFFASVPSVEAAVSCVSKEHDLRQASHVVICAPHALCERPQLEELMRRCAPAGKPVTIVALGGASQPAHADEWIETSPDGRLSAPRLQEIFTDAAKNLATTPQAAGGFYNMGGTPPSNAKDALQIEIGNLYAKGNTPPPAGTSPRI